MHCIGLYKHKEAFTMWILQALLKLQTKEVEQESIWCDTNGLKEVINFPLVYGIFWGFLME